MERQAHEFIVKFAPRAFDAWKVRKGDLESVDESELFWKDAQATQSVLNQAVKSLPTSSALKTYLASQQSINELVQALQTELKACYEKAKDIDASESDAAGLFSEVDVEGQLSKGSDQDLEKVLGTDNDLADLCENAAVESLDGNVAIAEELLARFMLVSARAEKVDDEKHKNACILTAIGDCAIAMVQNLWKMLSADFMDKKSAETTVEKMLRVVFAVLRNDLMNDSKLKTESEGLSAFYTPSLHPVFASADYESSLAQLYAVQLLLTGIRPQLRSAETRRKRSSSSDSDVSDSDTLAEVDPYDAALRMLLMASTKRSKSFVPVVWSRLLQLVEDTAIKKVQQIGRQRVVDLAATQQSVLSAWQSTSNDVAALFTKALISSLSDVDEMDKLEALACVKRAVELSSVTVNKTSGKSRSADVDAAVSAIAQWATPPAFVTFVQQSSDARNIQGIIRKNKRNTLLLGSFLSASGVTSVELTDAIQAYKKEASDEQDGNGHNLFFIDDSGGDTQAKKQKTTQV